MCRQLSSSRTESFHRINVNVGGGTVPHWGRCPGEWPKGGGSPLVSVLCVQGTHELPHAQARCEGRGGEGVAGEAEPHVRTEGLLCMGFAVQGMSSWRSARNHPKSQKASVVSLTPQCSLVQRAEPNQHRPTEIAELLWVSRWQARMQGPPAFPQLGKNSPLRSPACKVWGGECNCKTGSSSLERLSSFNELSHFK